jgi:hypothetical protein
MIRIDEKNKPRIIRGYYGLFPRIFKWFYNEFEGAVRGQTAITGVMAGGTKQFGWAGFKEATTIPYFLIPCHSKSFLKTIPYFSYQIIW